jgi:hypothetical protein
VTHFHQCDAPCSWKSEVIEAPDLDRIRVLLSAIRNSLRNGSYMTGGNLAFLYLCEQLGLDDESDVPEFQADWARRWLP